MSICALLLSGAPLAIAADLATPKADTATASSSTNERKPADASAADRSDAGSGDKDKDGADTKSEPKAKDASNAESKAKSDEDTDKKYKSDNEGKGKWAAENGKGASEGSLISGLLTPFRKERARWKEAGVSFSLHERSEVWGDVVGGGKRGLSYNGLTTAKLDFDLEKLAHWSGAEFFISGFDIHGHGPTRSHVGNLQLVSNIEATPSIKLYGLWLDQSLLDKKLSLRLGQEGANEEMMTTTYAGLFINSSFGFPGMPAAVLPSGGPNYPMATPFVRAKLKADDNWTLVGAVFNGDPAPPGPGDPQIRDRNGLAFRLNGHALMFGEVWYSPDPDAPEELPTTYKLGIWYASNHFADQRIDTRGMLLASPASTGLARRLTGDYALYGIIDQTVWKQPGTKDKGIGVFLEIMAGPADRNIADWFIAGGLNWRAPFKDREDDVFGIAFAYLGISPAARAFSRDLVSFGRAAAPYASNETVLEAIYLAKITDWLTLEPDIQLVINPGAGIPGNFGPAPLPHALVIGTRAEIKF